METKITATELARHLSDILNRVRYRGERFVVERNGERIATLAPCAGDRLPLLSEVAKRLKGLEWPDEDFANDVEWAKIHQPPMPEDPWPN